MNCYKKIIQFSNYFYNEGLEKAKVRDLTGAIECLCKSLRFFKGNIKARNLLGLVYFEVGETVQALREWVISVNFQSDENIAKYYIDQLQEDRGYMANVNQTVKKYNQAILYANNQNEDLAIIQLKKVVGLNPNFVKAFQLLALLYMKEGEFLKAKEVLRKAGRIDSNNTTTLKYLKEANINLHGEQPIKKSKKDICDDAVEYKSGNEMIIKPPSFKDRSALNTVINIVIGIAIGFCITYFLVFRAQDSRIKSDTQSQLIEANNAITSKNVTIKGLNKQIEELTKKVTSAETANTATTTEITTYQQLLVAYASFVSGEVEKAGEAIATISVANVSANIQPTCSTIMTQINAEYMKLLYQKGSSAYNQGTYKDAIIFYEKILTIDEKFQEGDAMYFLAQSYRKDGDKQKATLMYQKVIATFPNTPKAKNAQSYINEMNR